MYRFTWSRPDTIADAVAATAEGEARYLAGGQSLVQSMKLRLNAAPQLVSLQGIHGLRGINVDDRGVTVGAMTRHAEVAASALVRSRNPSLAELAGGIGDPMVRNMGTVGGSIANADPAADYPAAVVALDAIIRTDRRELAGATFYRGLFETALEPGELIMSVTFPNTPHAAYDKFKQPASRFALVGVFVARTATGVRVGVTGAKAHAFRCLPLEAALDRDFDPARAEAVRLPDDEMSSDLHASGAYRAALVSTLAGRAVRRMLEARPTT